MKGLVAAFFLMSGLLVAGGANAANVATITIPNCFFSSTYSQTTVLGSVGDTFTIIGTIGSCDHFTSSDTNVLTVANGGITQQNVPLLVTLVGIGTATLDFLTPKITVTVGPPAAEAVPSLSEWTQLMLGLMVMMLIGLHFHRERCY